MIQNFSSTVYLWSNTQFCSHPALQNYFHSVNVFCFPLCGFLTRLNPENFLHLLCKSIRRDRARDSRRTGFLDCSDIWAFWQICGKGGIDLTISATALSEQIKMLPLYKQVTFSERGLRNSLCHNTVLFLWERGKIAAKLRNAVVSDCNFNSQIVEYSGNLFLITLQTRLNYPDSSLLKLLATCIYFRSSYVFLSHSVSRH